MNPIYIEYYSHSKCDCYKIKLPYTKYKEEIIVLCPVSEGLETARIAAIGIITKNVVMFVMEPIK